MQPVDNYIISALALIILVSLMIYIEHGGETKNLSLRYVQKSEANTIPKNTKLKLYKTFINNIKIYHLN